jgi:hypothetical protein
MATAEWGVTAVGTQRAGTEKGVPHHKASTTGGGMQVTTHRDRRLGTLEVV